MEPEDFMQEVAEILLPWGALLLAWHPSHPLAPGEQGSGFVSKKVRRNKP